VTEPAGLSLPFEAMNSAWNLNSFARSASDGKREQGLGGNSFGEVCQVLFQRSAREHTGAFSTR
jgi:hypothetical protein